MPRNIEEICVEQRIHRKTFYVYQRLLDQARLLTELDETPEGRRGTRARWFSTSTRGEDFVRRYRLVASFLDPPGSIEKVKTVVDVPVNEEEIPMTEVTCSICGFPLAKLAVASDCPTCGFEFPLCPIEGNDGLFARMLEIHSSKLAEVESWVLSVSGELSEERKHSAELQREVESLYGKLEKITEGMDDVRGLIKTLQPLVKQVSGK